MLFFNSFNSYVGPLLCLAHCKKKVWEVSVVVCESTGRAVGSTVFDVNCTAV